MMYPENLLIEKLNQKHTGIPPVFRLKTDVNLKNYRITSKETTFKSWYVSKP